MDTGAVFGFLAIREGSHTYFWTAVVVVGGGTVAVMVGTLLLAVLQLRDEAPERWRLEEDFSSLLKLMSRTLPVSFTVAMLLVGLAPTPLTAARILAVAALVLVGGFLVWFGPAYALKESGKTRGFRRRVFALPIGDMVDRLRASSLRGEARTGKTTKHPVARHLVSVEMTFPQGTLRLLRIRRRRTVVELPPGPDWQTVAEFVERAIPPKERA